MFTSIFAAVPQAGCDSQLVTECAKTGLAAFRDSTAGTILQGGFQVFGFILALILAAKIITALFGKQDAGKAIKTGFIALLVLPFLFNIYLVLDMINVGGTAVGALIEFLSKLVNGKE